MNILPILPIVVLLTGSHPNNEPPKHPHYPMVTSLTGVGGKLTLSWYTVPYNPEQVKRVKANYVWNRGFRLQTEVAMKCGDTVVPAGTYGVAFKLGAEGKSWSIQLIPNDIARLKRQLGRIRRSGGDPGKIEAQLEALAKKGIKAFTLPAKTFAGKHAEHMTLFAINYGHKTSGRGRDAAPVSGIDGEFRASFGDLHTSFAFSEVLQEKQGDSTEKPRPNRRRRGDRVRR